MNDKKKFIKIYQKYSTPMKVQQLIRSLKYNREKNGETLRSAWETYKAKKAHCLEGAFLAAALLENKGYPPLVMSLESSDNLDHVVYVYKNKKNKWGAIGCSRDKGLHGRKPLFNTIKELALSYYEPYIDKTGCITGFQVVNLDDSRANWRSSQRNVWKVEQYLIDIKHVQLKFNKRKYYKILKNYLNGKMAKRQHYWS